MANTVGAVASTKAMLLPRPCNGQDWAIWLQHFEARAVIHKWNDNDLKLQWLVGCLTGSAELAFLHLPEATKSDYKKVCDALGERFAGADSYDVHIHNLEERRRTDGEKLGDFAGSVEQLAMLAWPTLESTARDEHSRRRFVMGLDPSLRVAVLRRKPTSLQEALRAAREEEALCSLASGINASTKSATQSPVVAAANAGAATTPAIVAPVVAATSTDQLLQKLAAQLGSLEKEVGELRADQRRRNSGPERGSGRDRGRFRMRCWLCSEEGHRARDCPRRGTMPGRREGSGASSSQKQQQHREAEN